MQLGLLGAGRREEEGRADCGDVPADTADVPLWVLNVGFRRGFIGIRLARFWLLRWREMMTGLFY